MSVILRTSVPILLLIFLGYLSRRNNLLKQGDERVLSSYIYYFALPSLFFINIYEVNFSNETLKYVFAGLAPTFLALGIFLIIFFLRIVKDKKTIYLLIVTTVFGSLAFFGIPFIIFAFGTSEAERLSALSASTISFVSVITATSALELYKLDGEDESKIKTLIKRFSKNPLILSTLLGLIVNLIGLEIPIFLSTSLHMLGSTTATVAIFMLGLFLYGRNYGNLKTAFGLSLLRIIFLPLVAVIILKFLYPLPSFESTIIVLMHGMPIAVSTIVLSERYDFFKETIASLNLISSLLSVFYLNLWLVILQFIF
ncbi:MAG: putative transporter YfdV [Candidatus Methanofastidiosum methylothiophilum]|uniref:Putative transporter YfdV n=1 Tax=Candidatus Methanofastidiosum methylothiophilum TaxID=1705564 RepID=A0A150J7J6_9EURY|nr:MAG: putative transporter YfdV [Candidatus Methanofastidiosum methylthiophilus]NMC77006.1 AEC family transporter [Candidatus Methanofastidiosa archaeon]